MSGDPAKPGTRKERFIARLGWLIGRAIYRDIDVHVAEPETAEAPVLSVANHFGGLSDAIVLLYAFDRPPRIIARDVIWKIPVAGAFMNWIGAIPVHKPEDGADRNANEQMFGSCYAALAEHHNLLIFPEGVTTNDPSMAPVKTGAARITLGARASGTSGVEIQPVGIHYEDKAALRSRAVVNVGPSIHLDAVAPDLDHEQKPITADDKAAVGDLTARIEAELRRVAPDYENWNEARALTSASEIVVRATLDDPRQAVPIGLRDRLANTLADRTPEQRATIRGELREYASDLDGLGVTDAELAHQLATGRFLLSVAGQLLVGLLLLPFALIGAAINVVPFLIVKAVGLLRVAPSVLSSIKPAVALLAFGVTWGVVVWRALRDFGIVGMAAAVVLLPVYSAATVVLADRAVLLWRTYRRWRSQPRAAGAEERLQAERDALLRSVLRVDGP